jgi:branched-chain amino acid transport system ATP-binding protein
MSPTAPGPTKDPALKVDGVTVQFQGHRALTGVSFDVPPGQRLALIGPNGAGKTTLLNIIGGQLSPTDGRVLVFNELITSHKAHDRAHRRIARSFQTSSAFRDLTVLDNVWLAITGSEPWRWDLIHRREHHRESFLRAETLLREWDLWPHHDRLVRTMSHGDQRKLETAMALACRPRLLLLDEPSAGLTVDESRSIIRHLRDLDREATALIVAHDMDLVFGVAERIVVLHHGEVIADGSADDVRSDQNVRQVYLGLS